MKPLALLVPACLALAGLSAAEPAPAPKSLAEAVAAGRLSGQARLAWSDRDLTVRLGRQRLVLDDARFIGDVGWRQNMQTYDAVTLVRSLPAKAALTYGYLARVNRVFGNRHPQGNWESDSHVLHFTRPGLPAGTTFSAHASLLDFASAPAQSCATFGAGLQGSAPVSAQTKLTWRAGAAWQRDHGASPLDYSARYLTAEAGLAARGLQFAVGFEELGSDGRQAFRTPLATLHASKLVLSCTN